MLRVGAYMAAGASNDVKPADAFGAAASMIPLGPIAASAILASYDYNGDDRISLSELTILPPRPLRLAPPPFK